MSYIKGETLEAIRSHYAPSENGDVRLITIGQEYTVVLAKRTGVYVKCDTGELHFVSNYRFKRIGQ